MDSFKQDAPQQQPSQPQQESSLHFLDYWRIIRIRKTVILAVFLLVVLTTTLVTFILPEFFASTVTIEVKKDISDIPEFGGSQVSTSFDPYFIQTEFEKIQSKSVLYKVIENLNLNQHYAESKKIDVNLKTEETFLFLKQAMSVSQMRNTELIDIKVYDQDPEKAAQIANEIARVYKEWRVSTSDERAQAGIQSAEVKLLEEEQELRNLEEELVALRKEYDVVDLDEQSRRSLMEQYAQRLSQNFNQYERDKAEYNKAKNRLEHLKTMDRDQLKVAIPSMVPEIGLSVPLESLLRTEAELEKKLASLDVQFGEQHPEVKSTRQELAQTQDTLDQTLFGIVKGFESDVLASKSALSEMENDISELEVKIRNYAETILPYVKVQNDYERQKNVVETVKLKIIQEAFNKAVSKSSIVNVINPAEPAMSPEKPKKALNIALGVVVGLVVGVGLAFFIEYLDTSVKTIDDVERALQTHVLGVIPQNVGSILEEGTDSPHAEAYRVLRTNILFSRKAEDHNTLTVVSGGAGEGKSTTLFNLACIFSQNGERVLVVDSDLRRPSIHKILNISNSLGLTNVLLNQNKLEEVIQKTNENNLDVMPSGKLPNSAMGILSSARMKDLITELKKRYDFVFFDSPPIMGVSDASVLASEVDMTVQVIQYRRYPQPMTLRAKQMIEKVGGNLLGVVLNNINLAQDESYYYYSGYYYDYYSKHDDDSEDGRVKKNGKKPDKKTADAGARVDLKQKF